VASDPVIGGRGPEVLDIDLFVESGPVATVRVDRALQVTLDQTVRVSGTEGTFIVRSIVPGAENEIVLSVGSVSNESPCNDRCVTGLLETRESVLEGQLVLVEPTAGHIVPVAALTLESDGVSYSVREARTGETRPVVVRAAVEGGAVVSFDGASPPSVLVGTCPALRLVWRARACR
jgi:hypothetical protein